MMATAIIMVTKPTRIRITKMTKIKGTTMIVLGTPTKAIATMEDICSRVMDTMMSRGYIEMRVFHSLLMVF
jgi:hypothetical protein